MKRTLITAPILAALVLVLGGCGAAQGSGPKPKQRRSGVELPFDNDVPTEKAEQKKADTVEEEIDLNDIQIPGAKFGDSGRENGAVPYTYEIEGQMAGLQWGMTYQAVMSIYRQQIKDIYKDSLFSAQGAIEEDRIRSGMLREIAKLEDSYVEFKGKKTGYETTFIADDFTHKNKESMFIFDGGKYVEYFFFFEGRLWKRLRAFRKDSFAEDITFGLYIATLEERFGRGLDSFDPETGQLKEIRWQDDTTYMAARDNSMLFGVFCMVFSAKITEHNLPQLRVHRAPAKQQRRMTPSDQIAPPVRTHTVDEDDGSLIDAYTGVDATKTDE